MSANKKNYFLNPVGALADRFQLLTSIVILWLSIFISYKWGVAHDGIFHATFIQKQSLPFLLLSNIIVVVLPALFLLFVGKYYNKGTRFIDMCNSMLFSRLPLIISYAIFFVVMGADALNNIQVNPQHAINSFTKSDENKLVLVGFILLPFLIYSFVLLINGFKTSMYAKKPIHYVWMIIAVLVSEIIYRLIIYPNLLKFSQ